MRRPCGHAGQTVSPSTMARAGGDRWMLRPSLALALPAGRARAFLFSSARSAANISERLAPVSSRSRTPATNGSAMPSKARQTSTSSPSSSTRSRRTSVPGFSTVWAGLASIRSCEAHHCRSRRMWARARLAAVLAPRSAIPLTRLITSRLRIEARDRSPHKGITSRSISLRTSPTVRFLAWSRLIHSSTAARTLSFAAASPFAAARLSARSPAGSRPLATSPRMRLASARAVSTVHGEPSGPMVTLRSGAARPRPARYMRMKLLAPFGLMRRP